MRRRAREIDGEAAARRLPFAGVPLVLKDLNAPAAGLELTQGSRFRRGYIPRGDSEVVARLRRAGFVIVGRSNAAEYGASNVTEPLAWGPARNPWNPARSPGGSSGGAAAAVAAGFVPIGQCNDAGGSGRLPASYCGLLGVEPSRGRTPDGPELGELWRGMVVTGAIARSVRDAAGFLDAIAGPDVGAPHHAPAPDRPFLEAAGEHPGSLRIAFTTAAPLAVEVDKEQAKSVADAAKLLAELGHRVEERRPDFDEPAFFRAFMIFGAIGAAFAMRLDSARISRKPRAGEHEPATRSAARFGGSLSATDYEMANLDLRREARRIAALFEDFDVWLTPTVTRPAPLVGAAETADWDEIAHALRVRFRLGGLRPLRLISEDTLGRRYRSTAFLPLANATGHPALSVPFAIGSDGLPIGIHVMGRFGAEATLFRLAAQLEEAGPWARHLPGLRGNSATR